MLRYALHGPYGQVKAAGAAEVHPKWLSCRIGANSPLSSEQVGSANTAGVFLPATGPRLHRARQPPTREAYIAKTAGMLPASTTARLKHSGRAVLEAVAAKTGKVDNATIISTLHSGTWPTLLGTVMGQGRCTKGRTY